jgi:hypothetical protein
VVAIWEYDKRSVNGANFVYFGMRLVSGDTARSRALVEYGARVVAALGILHGPTHMEVIYQADGPCLVEVGARCHGGEGSWIPVAQECVGYTQLDVTLSCYLRPDRFDAIPAVPALLKQGREAYFVCTQTGTLMDIPGIGLLRALKSFRYHSLSQCTLYLYSNHQCIHH